MITYAGKRTGAPALVGFVFTGVLAIFLSAPSAHAQSATISAGPTDPPESSFSNDLTLINPCFSYPSDACIAVAAFDANQASYWYINGGSSNGIGDDVLFYYVNGVYTGEYTTNSNSNPGAIVAVVPLGVNIGFLGAEHGSCTNDTNYVQSWTVTVPFSASEVYTLGLPYTCS